MAERKRQEFIKQFQDVLRTMEAHLKVGYSMENTLKEVSDDLKLRQKNSILTREFQTMNRQLELNVPVEEIWKEFSERVDLLEVRQFVTVFVLAKRSGGDGIEIIRKAISQMSEHAEIRQEIETVIYAKKMEFQIMSLIPFGIIGYLKLVFPDFLGLLYGNLFGVCFMSICLGIYFAAWKIGRKIVTIEV